MKQENLGNNINKLLRTALWALFSQGTLFQLTYTAFEHMVKKIQEEDLDEYELRYPIGFNSNKTPMLANRTYKKQELIDEYASLATNQIAINGIYQIVTIVESVLGDLVRKVIQKYPKKIGEKRSIPSSMVLACQSIEEIHAKTIDSILNQLSYKSPREFAVECEGIFSINLLECPSFHRYMEIKATRDIYIHNLGIVNEIYVGKAGSHARAGMGNRLPIDIHYLLESYESSIQLIEWLENAFHVVWPSSDLEQRLTAQETEQGNQAAVKSGAL